LAGEPVTQQFTVQSGSVRQLALALGWLRPRLSVPVVGEFFKLSNHGFAIIHSVPGPLGSYNRQRSQDGDGRELLPGDGRQSTATGRAWIVPPIQNTADLLIDLA
jgi:hypothetical protein